MSMYEDKDICRECGGFCCKKSGCDYSPRDFSDLSINKLHEKLLEGNISIISYLEFKRSGNGKLYAEPFLYLRARNTDRDVVDLVSYKKRCSMLREDGCSYSFEERPFGGRNLIPGKTRCVPEVDPYDIVMEWGRYQKVLHRLVKRITGMSVDNKVREDVYNLFVQFLREDFEGVNLIELEDVKIMIPSLVEIYPDEFRRAVAAAKGGRKVYCK